MFQASKIRVSYNYNDLHFLSPFACKYLVKSLFNIKTNSLGTALLYVNCAELKVPKLLLLLFRMSCILLVNELL